MDRQLSFVLKRFSDYYQKAEFRIPGIEKREFGFGTEKKIDARHLSFANAQELRSFLVNSTPLYVSHSAAYYAHPAATPMERKGWLGADLVFDLDYEAQGKHTSKEEFGRVRADALRLIEEFLIPDFGVRKEFISVNFSGNRGFHIHVRDSRFSRLRGDERKEIIEYVKGTGLSYDAFFSKEEAGRSGGRAVFRESGPVPSPSGYAGRFGGMVLRMLETEPEALSRIFKDRKKRDAFASGIRAGNWSMRSLTPTLDRKLREMAERLSLRTVNIDSGVTQDASKLIRVPDSLHGGTGLRAKTIPLPALQFFEPMRDAVALPSTPVKIAALEEIPSMEIGGMAQERMEKGKEGEVPEYFAIYLAQKGSARIL